MGVIDKIRRLAVQKEHSPLHNHLINLQKEILIEDDPKIEENPKKRKIYLEIEYPGSDFSYLNLYAWNEANQGF